MRLAFASMAFSTSSLTTLAGRSTTSPAAILFTTLGGNCLICDITVSELRCGGVVYMQCRTVL